MENQQEQEYIYIVFIKSMTTISKITRKVVDYEYTHMSIAFNEKLDDFVTFARRNLYTPIDAGIVYECRSNYAFENMEEFKTKIFKLPATKEELFKVKEIISRFENDEEYMFNLFSMVTMPIFHGFRVYKAHNCMSFISLVISKLKCITMEKPYYKYLPSELAEVMKDYVLFEGMMKKDDRVIEKFAGQPDKVKNFFISTGIIFKLIYRMIFLPGKIKILEDE